MTSSYKYIFIDSIPQLLYYQPQALLHYLRKHRRNSVPYIFNFLILPNTETIFNHPPCISYGPPEELKCFPCLPCKKTPGARPSASVSASDRRCSNLNGFAVDPGSLRVHAWSHVTKWYRFFSPKKFHTHAPQRGPTNMAMAGKSPSFSIGDTSIHSW